MQQTRTKPLRCVAKTTTVCLGKIFLAETSGSNQTNFSCQGKIHFQHKNGNESAQSKFSREERFHASPLICCVRFEIHRSKEFVRPEPKFLRLVGEVARRAGGVSHPRVIPQGKQKGRYDPARETKTALWPPHGEQKGRYDPRRMENRRDVTVRRTMNRTNLPQRHRSRRPPRSPRHRA